MDSFAVVRCAVVPAGFRWPGYAPGRAPSFLCVAKAKKAKERRPHWPCPFAALRATCDARGRGAAAELTSLLRSFVQTTAASQSTRRGHFSLPTRAPPAALLGTARRGGSPTRAIAALGLGCVAQAASRHLMGSGSILRFDPSRNQPRAKRSDGPCGVPTPSGCAWGGVLAGWRVHRRMHALRDLTRGGCLSAARQRVASSHRAPRQHPDPGRPAAQAEGSQPAGARFFGYFLVVQQESTSAAGPTPGLPASIKPTKTSKNIATSAIQESARAQKNPKPPNAASTTQAAQSTPPSGLRTPPRP